MFRGLPETVKPNGAWDDSARVMASAYNVLTSWLYSLWSHTPMCRSKMARFVLYSLITKSAARKNIQLFSQWRAIGLKSNLLLYILMYFAFLVLVTGPSEAPALAAVLWPSLCKCAWQTGLFYSPTTFHRASKRLMSLLCIAMALDPPDDSVVPKKETLLLPFLVP